MSITITMIEQVANWIKIANETADKAKLAELLDTQVKDADTPFDDVVWDLIIQHGSLNDDMIGKLSAHGVEPCFSLISNESITLTDDQLKRMFELHRDNDYWQSRLMPTLGYLNYEVDARCERYTKLFYEIYSDVVAGDEGQELSRSSKSGHSILLVDCYDKYDVGQEWAYY
ncbi:MAG: hypothetical protein WAZ19_16640 [Anaerolineae bacterium]